MSECVCVCVVFGFVVVVVLWNSVRDELEDPGLAQSFQNV